MFSRVLRALQEHTRNGAPSLEVPNFCVLYVFLLRVSRKTGVFLMTLLPSRVHVFLGVLQPLISIAFDKATLSTETWHIATLVGFQFP